MIRIVSMHFKESECEVFLELFRTVEANIRSFPGCSHLELLRDIEDPCRFVTYSHWVNQEALNTYRKSVLFQSTWAATKVLFDEKPLAWSLQHFQNLDSEAC